MSDLDSHAEAPTSQSGPPPRPLFSPSSRAGRWVQAALVVLPVGFFIAGIVVSERARDYKVEDVARRLRAERKLGDLIAVGPGVTLHGFARIPGVVSIAEPLQPALFRRIFVVALASSPVPVMAVGVALPPPQRTQAFGRFRVTEHAMAKESLFDAIHGATVRFVHKNGRVDTCRGMRTGEFECPLHGWLKVEPASLAVRGRSLECITAHPAAEGALHISFPALRLGPTLFLRTALADTATPPPVHVEVRAGDHALGAFDHASIPGWETHDLPTGALAGSESPLDLVLTVPAGGRSHFCFAGGT